MSFLKENNIKDVESEASFVVHHSYHFVHQNELVRDRYFSWFFSCF